MTEQDVPSGLRLNTLSGWNQTDADWSSFLRQSPAGCFVMEIDGNIVGTVATISYQNRFSWIGMVLVDPEYRKMGIGTRLLHKAVEYLDQAGIPTLKLDATPLGQPLYAKLGFVAEYEIERFILNRPPQQTSKESPPSTVSENDLVRVYGLDAELFGADRSFLLRSLYQRSPQLTWAVHQEGSLTAYAFGRQGLFADHLGPWAASNSAASETILQSFLSRSTREILIVDCMKSNSMAVALLQKRGFSVSRRLTRMGRGPNSYPGKPDSLCAILGPEFG